MIQVWKDIKGFKGKYRISNFGRVLSLESKALGRNGSMRKIKARILKPGLSGGMYLTVNLCDNGPLTSSVHKLVWDYFGNKEQIKGLEIDHIDGNKLNNHINNLQLLTQRQNTSKSQTNRTGFTGLFYQKNGYQAQIIINKKRFCKSFRSVGEALAWRSFKLQGYV